MQQITGIDVGLPPWQNFATPATIGDTVWVDANANGAVDADETRLAGVSVRLWIDENSNGVQDGGELPTTAPVTIVLYHDVDATARSRRASTPWRP